MSLRRQYLDHAESMPVGHRVRIDGRAFREAFGLQLTSFHPLAPERAGPESDFLSGCIGSAYGRIRCRHEAFNDYYEVSKHEDQEPAGGARFHVDFDREHYYRRRPDGMWEPRQKASAAQTPHHGKDALSVRPNTNPSSKPREES